MKIIIILLCITSLLSSSIPYSDAVPELDRERSYEKADFILYGEILSVDVLSESIQTQDKNNYQETPGHAIYSIKIHHFLKNSLDTEIINAYGEYIEFPHGMSYTPALYQIGDDIEFYIYIVNETDSSHEYQIDVAASRNIPDECNYDLQPDKTAWLFNTHTCSWEQIATNENFDESICGLGTELHDGQCYGIVEAEPSQGDCLIATASYGSELAPQVQMLREIRDNTLLNTESGKIFMNGFNTVYYLFSPQIAQLEDEHPIFKETVKLFTTPMITTLSIMTLAHEDSEFDVLFLGASTIGLIVGMYVVAPITIIRFFVNG